MGWNQTDTYLLATLTGVLFGAISLAGLGTVLPNRAVLKFGQILFASGLPAVLGLWLVLKVLGVGN
jgi:hypothetical protein